MLVSGAIDLLWTRARAARPSSTGRPTPSAGAGPRRPSARSTRCSRPLRARRAARRLDRGHARVGRPRGRAGSPMRTVTWPTSRPSRPRCERRWRRSPGPQRPPAATAPQPFCSGCPGLDRRLPGRSDSGGLGPRGGRGVVRDSEVVEAPGHRGAATRRRGPPGLAGADPAATAARTSAAASGAPRRRRWPRARARRRGRGAVGRPRPGRCGSGSARRGPRGPGRPSGRSRARW